MHSLTMNYKLGMILIMLEKEMATHSSILAWRIPGTEEPGGLPSLGSHRVRHDWSDLACMHALEEKMATHSSILAWRIPGTEEPGGLPSLGSHRGGHDWSYLAAAASNWDRSCCFWWLAPLLQNKHTQNLLATLPHHPCFHPIFWLGENISWLSEGIPRFCLSFPHSIWFSICLIAGIL